MAQFKYRLPSGSEFLVDAPQGTTQSQADFVFYTQVAAGTFTGYAAGQTLSSVATRLAEFNLSRLERDTAGVVNPVILSIVQQSPVIAPVPSLTNIPLENPITPADIAQININAVPDIGPLPPAQVAALMAQQKNLPAPPDVVVVTEFKFTCNQLEKSGVFKPGVCARDTFPCNLKSPDSWTGKYNLNSYNDLINNETAQIQIQAALYQQAYDSLTSAGIIQTAPTPAVSVTTGEVWTNSKGLVEATALGVLTGSIKDASSLYNKVYLSLSGAGNGIGGIAGSVTGLASSVTGSINGIASSVTGLASNVQNTANSLLNTSLSSVTAGATTLLNNTINGGLNSITNTVAGGVGALVSNASTFGTAITGLWAGGGFSSVSSLTGGLNSALGSVSGIATGITGSIGGLTSSLGSLTNGLTGLPNLSSLSSLTGLTSGSLGSLSGLLSSSGLTGLGSSALGSLSGIASGALGSATGLVSGTLGNLGGLAQNALGSLGTSLDLAGKMSSFSIDLSIFSNSSLASLVQKAPAFTNTVSRATVDGAVQQILGNAKIPVPSFEFPPNIDSVAAQLDVSYAKNLLSSISSPVTNLIGQTQATVNNLTTAATNVGATINRLKV